MLWSPAQEEVQVTQRCSETALGINSPGCLGAVGLAGGPHGTRGPWVEQYEARSLQLVLRASAGAAAADGREPGSLMEEAEEPPGGPAEASSS